ncbi:Aste57867_20521 [Aphanomyces stellatus]|uniref:Aste57867_20521 protein n=1 Tax=Aphanomyces stellatus TaxID=120398 RepID=A0A485LFA1_9STRA|nr:hypothetical protein As57867_020454 [Aphanomyces stellatus]VFT97206.1 Aste57867_20521 [Aphanomyces stellatus]
MTSSPLSPTQRCFFNGCDKPVDTNSWRCIAHRHRGRCDVPDCCNQAYARKLCVKHGGKKTCRIDGCNQRARLANVCYTHGGRHTKRQCSFQGCVNPAQAHQRCCRHGGRRKCSVQGCTTFARSGGVCCRHNNYGSDGVRSAHVPSAEDRPPSWRDMLASEDEGSSTNAKPPTSLMVEEDDEVAGRMLVTVIDMQLVLEDTVGATAPDATFWSTDLVDVIMSL